MTPATRRQMIAALAAARSAAEARLAEIQRIKAQIAIDEEAARQSLESAIRREREIGSMLEQDES